MSMTDKAFRTQRPADLPTPIANDEELIARLRRTRPNPRRAYKSEATEPVNPDGPEAADRIATLLALTNEEGKPPMSEDLPTPPNIGDDLVARLIRPDVWLRVDQNGQQIIDGAPVEAAAEITRLKALLGRSRSYVMFGADTLEGAVALTIEIDAALQPKSEARQSKGTGE